MTIGMEAAWAAGKRGRFGHWALAMTLACSPFQSQAHDDDALEIVKRNNCFKCHAIDKVKNAPPFRKVSSRMKSKPDAVEVIIKHITTSPTVQLYDERYEEHKVIDIKDDPEKLRRFAEWILSLSNPEFQDKANGKD